MELKLKVDLIPEPCWYKNVRKMIERSIWNEIREAVLFEQGNECGICTSRQDPHCHELWEYDLDGCIQTLTGFAVVCKMCHFVIHYGLTRMLVAEGKLKNADPVIKHFMKVNGVKRRVFDEHVAEADQIFSERSKANVNRKWTMALGKYGEIDNQGRIVRIDLRISKILSCWAWEYPPAGRS
jgi:hypothetical protein